jgi:hypothetical protein
MIKCTNGLGHSLKARAGLVTLEVVITRQRLWKGVGGGEGR